VRNFLCISPQLTRVTHLDQLRRDPNPGWMSRMRSQKPPLATGPVSALIALRCVFNELHGRTRFLNCAPHSPRRHPRTPQRLPRPLTAEQDQTLQQEFLRRNDWAETFLLLRHTGMRSVSCRPILRLPSAFAPDDGDSCPPRQAQNRTHGPHRRFRGNCPTLRSFVLSIRCVRWTTTGPSKQQECARSPTARLLAPGLLFTRPST